MATALNSAQASDVYTASIDLTPYLKNLRVKRGGRTIRLRDAKILLLFKDPHDRHEIERILLDPQYHSGLNPDFSTETVFQSPVSDEDVTEFSTCYWDSSGDKTIALCGVDEMDGGYYQIKVEKRGSSLKDSCFKFVIARLKGFSGFQLGYDPPVGHESKPARVVVTLEQDVIEVIAPINF